MFDQYIVYITLILVLVLFVWGRWRYDIVAVMGLLFLTVAGIVPGAEAFTGFSHPAVITVAAVLMISRALMNAGLVDSVVRLMSNFNKNQFIQLAILVLAVTISSGFMNNIGALAIFMPVAIRMARKSGVSASIFLMPMAFASLHGGLMTQIGTPPNIIISLYRAETAAAVPFQMFDFTPVGAGVALVGALFVILIGWRLIPCREGEVSPEDIFKIEGYLTEVYVPENSKFAGKRILDLGRAIDGDITVVGHVRDRKKLPFLSPYRTFNAGDHIMIKANAEDLKDFLEVTGLELAESRKLSQEDLSSDEITVMEAVVTANSEMEKQTARSLDLRSVYGINLLGISRAGAHLRARPDRISFKVGDVLLLQGRVEVLQSVLSKLGCLPLVERGLKVGQPRKLAVSFVIFASALFLAAFGIIPIQISFMAAALAMILFGVLPLREIYNSIDWPVIVLIGAMIPVSQALETTGGAQTIANSIVFVAGNAAPWVTLTVVLVATMFLSDIVNNAAAAVLMAPIVIGVAKGMGVSADPFLMSVALGASCAFLTPIGHQSNALVMGPGGYKFGDYWRMGLPLEIIIVLVGIPLIMMVWPM